MYQQPPRPRSPYAPPQNSPQIAPGALTYTTSIGPDGRTIYNIFRAVPASYQTSNGIVHGIQWVHENTNHILPAGAQPATPEFTASWNKSSDSAYADRERQREEEKKRKKKEKEEPKIREHRKSFVGTNPPVGFPPSTSPGYPPSPYVGSSPYATSNKPYSDLERQFQDLDVSGRGAERARTISGNYGFSPYGTTPGPQTRPYATTGPHISAYANPSPNMRAADVLPSTSAGYPASPYSSGKSVDPVAPIARASSPQPYGPTTSAYGYPQPPRSRATTPIPGSVPAYPPPRAPSPMPAYPPPRAPSPMPAYPRSRPVSPMPGPEIRSNQPTVPDSFSRPVNVTLTYPPFEPIKIHDMDDFLTRLPKLPLVLQPHDVNHHDWIRLTQDLSLAWAGKMPIPPERAANPPKRPNLVAELLHVWNTAFFLPRAIEVVLYKGNIRYSGPKAGIADLPQKQDDYDDYDDSSSSSESSSDEPFYGAPSQSVGPYGNQYNIPATHPHYAAEVQDARRKRYEERAERKRRRKERRLKRKQKEKEKKFSLYVVFAAIAVPGAMPGGYHTGRPGGY